MEQLTLQVDGATLTLAHPFVFGKDPNIFDIRPLRSYLSGGREILVRGEFLDTVQQPRMAVFDPDDNDNKPLNETVSIAVSRCTRTQRVCLLKGKPTQLNRYVMMALGFWGWVLGDQLSW